MLGIAEAELYFTVCTPLYIACILNKVVHHDGCAKYAIDIICGAMKRRWMTNLNRSNEPQLLVGIFSGAEQS